MKRRRPVFINIAVVFFLFYYLVPLESLLSFVFGIIDKLVRSGGGAAFAHLKQVFSKDLVYEHIRTIFALLSIGGLLRLNKIALLTLTALIAYKLFPALMSGQVALLWVVLPVVFLGLTWYFYLHIPKEKVVEADVHRADQTPKRTKETGREAGRKALDELIY